MELLPAIDLRAGTAVRLTQGDFGREERYGDPAALAARYIAGGARLDPRRRPRRGPHGRGARARVRWARSSASPAPPASAWSSAAASDPRTTPTGVLESGVARVVLGTAALEEPALAGRCARRWPGRIAVGLDYRVGEDGVAEAQAQGWLAGSGRAVPELLELWEREPIGAVVATSVARDGMLVGARSRRPAGAPGGDLPAGGGIGRRGGRRRPEGAGRPRRPPAAAWRGAIVGKAIVEGRLSVEEGIAACAVSA